MIEDVRYPVDLSLFPKGVDFAIPAFAEAKEAGAPPPFSPQQ